MDGWLVGRMLRSFIMTANVAKKRKVYYLPIYILARHHEGGVGGRECAGGHWWLPVGRGQCWKRIKSQT